jgi:hypothetical protein
MGTGEPGWSNRRSGKALTRRIGSVILRFRSIRQRVGDRRLRFIGRAALIAWFFDWTFVRISGLLENDFPIGMDIRIYYRGVEEWLHGGLPWTAGVAVHQSTFSYAGSPATTVMLVPAALFSEDQFAAIWLVLTALSALAIVRLLRLPPWWLLFPPTAEAVYSGNPQLVVLLLLLIGGQAGGLADSLAVALKVYALGPILGTRPLKRAGLALGLTLATVVLAPSLWIAYVEQFGAISARLANEAGHGFSAFYYPWLLVPTGLAILLLWRRDRTAAGWLAVPALWPASEFHYSTFAQPVMTPLLSVLLAIPLPLVAPSAILLDIVWRFKAAPVKERFTAWAAEASGDPQPPSDRLPASPAPVP